MGQGIVGEVFNRQPTTQRAIARLRREPGAKLLGDTKTNLTNDTNITTPGPYARTPILQSLL